MLETILDALEKKWRRFSANSKLALISAFFVGIVAHISMVTNYFMNHDTISFLYETPDIAQSRWFGAVVEKFLGEVLSPNICIILGIIFIAISAALTVAYLDIKSKWFSIIIGCMMVVFPAVVCTNTYIFASAEYFLALLLSCLSFYFSNQRKIGMIISILFLRQYRTEK